MNHQDTKGTKAADAVEYYEEACPWCYHYVPRKIDGIEVTACPHCGCGMGDYMSKSLRLARLQFAVRKLEKAFRAFKAFIKELEEKGHGHHRDDAEEPDA